MRKTICLLALLLICGSAFAQTNARDCVGVVRAIGDQTSWFSSGIVVGDGSWVVTSNDAVTEKISPDVTQTVRNPVFISSYTGQAWECEVKASDKDLNLALIKLPVKGLPAVPLAQISAFAKAAYGTTGDLMSGDPIGNKWPTRICGIAREKLDSGYQLSLSSWEANKVFVVEVDKYKWVFVIDTFPEKPISKGSVVMYDTQMVGMYLGKLVITSGNQKQVFGRCVMSTEIAQFLGKHGVDTATLYTPPAATAKPEKSASEAFQYQARLYTALAAGMPDRVFENAQALAKTLPNDANAKLMLASALIGKGKYEEAIKAIDEVTKMNPSLPALKLKRAMALVGLKKQAEAEAELLKAAEEAPKDTRPIIALTDFYLSDEKTRDKALSCAKRLSTMAPQSPTAHMLVAKIEKEMKHYQKAIDELGQALKLAPDWGDAWFALGSTFEQAGDMKSAEKAYRQLVAKQPQNPTSIMTLASFLADQGKKDEPLELIGKIRALKPEPPKGVLDVAKSLEEKINK